MIVKTFGSAVLGVSATTITIEVNIDKGAQWPWSDCRMRQ